MRKKLMLLVCLLLVAIAGCGGPKYDVNVYVLPSQGIPAEVSDKLDKGMKARVGETPSANLDGSPIYNPQLLLVKVTAGEYDILIIGKNDFLNYTMQGGAINLEDTFKKEDYPDGVAEANLSGNSEKPQLETHLYGIPMSKTKWMQEAGYRGEEVYALIFPRAKNIAAAKQVLKTLVEK
jgi:hypothetical protein